jgi:hypothetical protein
MIGLRGRSGVGFDVNRPKQSKSRVEGGEATAKTARPAKQVDDAVSTLGFRVDE